MISPARRVAYDVLRAVHASDAYANLLLPSRIRDAGLSAADAAFATELTYGALRMQGYDDRVIALAARRPVARIDPEVLDALRLGVRQLLGMRVPAHAAVDEAVSLVIAARKRSASGFANGVLRAVSRSTSEEWRARVVDGLVGDALLAADTAHPEWVVEALRDALAAEGAEAELADLLAADNRPPRVALVALPGLADPADLGEPGAVSPVAVASPGGDPAALPLVAAGRARVQDEGSQLAALAMSRARPVAPGERWLDLCAGPGGKAALLAAEARIGGAVLEANELVPARAGLVRRALEVFDPAPVVHEGDGVAFARGHAGVFDRILLDAPCTGLGALRRRPEARWRKQPSDLAALTALQAELLDAAVVALKPGGILAYVTCSPHLGETRDQVAVALVRHPGLRTLDTPAVLADVASRDLGLPAATSAQLWPHRHGTDAMFIQLLTVDA
ncbi:RsmB/NOP family class I SAM-dependent RNA methyltransferase [Pseudolysinimonas sp.]|uniref:RsmB/NOP family class I SAM-dependent RNA methyltransferase n=1 Tax=Pseudolysinimonas sp. TaxID=2680009 RepID=UPI003F7F0DAF